MTKKKTKTTKNELTLHGAGGFSSTEEGELKAYVRENPPSKSLKKVQYLHVWYLKLLVIGGCDTVSV